MYCRDVYGFIPCEPELDGWESYGVCHAVACRAEHAQDMGIVGVSGFVSLDVLASICGLSAGVLYTLRPAEWREGREYVFDPDAAYGAAMRFRRFALSDFVAVLASAGRKDAAARLRCWLATAEAGDVVAGGGGTSAAGKSTRKKAPSFGWQKQWEDENE